MKRTINLPKRLYREDGLRVCTCCDNPFDANSEALTCGCVTPSCDADDDILLAFWKQLEQERDQHG